MGETLLFTMYTHYGSLIKFLNSNPGGVLAWGSGLWDFEGLGLNAGFAVFRDQGFGFFRVWD